MWTVVQESKWDNIAFCYWIYQLDYWNLYLHNLNTILCAVSVDYWELFPCVYLSFIRKSPFVKVQKFYYCWVVFFFTYSNALCHIFHWETPSFIWCFHSYCRLSAVITLFSGRQSSDLPSILHFAALSVSVWMRVLWKIIWRVVYFYENNPFVLILYFYKYLSILFLSISKKFFLTGPILGKRKKMRRRRRRGPNQCKETLLDYYDSLNSGYIVTIISFILHFLVVLKVPNICLLLLLCFQFSINWYISSW